MEDFPTRKRFHAEWFWEGGFNLHPIYGLEEMRDWNFRAIFGAWNAMKNKGGKAEHANAKLEWIAYIGGTRESRQLLGDVVLTREDITEKRPFPMARCRPRGTSICTTQRSSTRRKFPEEPFISKAVFDRRVDKQHGYPVPYRCMYSKNIENLFMAGRDISRHARGARHGARDEDRRHDRRGGRQGRVHLPEEPMHAARGVRALLRGTEGAARAARRGPARDAVTRPIGCRRATSRCRRRRI